MLVLVSSARGLKAGGCIEESIQAQLRRITVESLLNGKLSV